MKYFWHFIAVVNTILLAMFVYKLYSDTLLIYTDTTVSGDVRVEASMPGRY